MKNIITTSCHFMERLHDATLFRGEEVAFLHGRHAALGLLAGRGVADQQKCYNVGPPLTKSLSWCVDNSNNYGLLMFIVLK